MNPFDLIQKIFEKFNVYVNNFFARRRGMTPARDFDSSIDDFNDKAFH